ncbi:Sorting nexin-30 [Liparis tanakae]|uniref:Sorting nexin-30 n=1 Tax=Liparis tanakae TaxID=230148 RepID=A0A4Z2J7L0_9TELE|nr:Sorting nexin-30 [Liparis tanakae]
MSVGAPRCLASSGQKPIAEILHPLSAAEEQLSVTATAGGDTEAGLTNGAPVETSSPASTSSLFNRLQLDEDLEADVRDPYDEAAETRDLFVTVDDPKKHVSTMETYITYRVSTKVCYWLVSCGAVVH